ncbi:hypothetical protein B0H13DRAFT_2381816 [Mycena leptocephala]|nr:hypothetical protein B0H13DRAFT_2381816 [Mycena leptocephala]
MPAMPSMGQFTIPMLVGTLVNWGLLGTLFVQVYVYFLAFPRDKLSFKLIVGFVVIAEILQTLGDTRDAARIFGEGWGNLQALELVGWAWFSVPIMESTIGCVGQLFFAWRIAIFGKSWYIPAVIAAVTLFQFGAGVWSGVLILRAKTFEELQFHSLKVPAVRLTPGLQRQLFAIWSSSPPPPSTCTNGGPEVQSDNTSRSLPDSQAAQVTVETGVLCALFALVNLYLFVSYSGGNNHLGICIYLSKVYSNSMMVVLNSRAHIGHDSCRRDKPVDEGAFELRQPVGCAPSRRRDDAVDHDGCNMALSPQSPTEIASAFVEAITAGDTDTMAALMTDDFVWRMLPATLGALARNKREYLLRTAELGRIFAWFKISVGTPLDVVETEDAAVMHLVEEGQLATDADCLNECIMIFRCDGGGVRSMTEFMDSENMRRVLEAGDISWSSERMARMNRVTFEHAE